MEEHDSGSKPLAESYVSGRPTASGSKPVAPPRKQPVVFLQQALFLE